MNRPFQTAALLLLAPLCAPRGAAQPAESIAPYFGFDEPRIVKVDNDCGPVLVADFNGDGRPDVAIVNNRKSRIEIHYLRPSPRGPGEQERVTRANELPPNPWYDREYVSVAHRVSAVRAYDVDGDGRLDLIYAGVQPAELVVMRQESPSRFTVMSKTRVKDMAARQDGLEVADVVGDRSPEVLALAGGKISVFSLDSKGRLGEPRVLGSGDVIRGIRVEDFDGDGRMDVLAVVPDDAAPVRLWLQTQDPGARAKEGMLASELRFEMPSIRDVATVRFRGRPAASVGVIERTSQRVVFYDLAAREVGGESEAGIVSEREVQAEVTGFPDSGVKGRPAVAADLTGNGKLDLLSVDQKGNAILVYRQRAEVGLTAPESFPAFKTPKQVDVGAWFTGAGSGGRPQVFVLSEEEKAVGVARIDGEGRVGFPTPISFNTAGATPTVMKLVPGPAPTLAVILKDRRDYALELHTRSGDGAEWKTGVETAALKDVKRDPSAILPFDFDGDGVTDLLILTPGESMMIVRCVRADGHLKPDKVLTRETMPQFGLVQAAGPDNTLVMDVDGDGRPELLIADSNYIRFAAYGGEGAGAGWRVVDQVNVPDSSAQLVGVALLTQAGGGEAQIIASDKANGRLLVFAKGKGGRWALRERVRLAGFGAGPIRAGAFSGDGAPGVVALSDDAFALVRLGGNRRGLAQFAAWRSEAEGRLNHKITCGDINGDGYSDAIILDAREQMCQVLTFSASRKVMPAMEFKVFESRLFERGDSRELQPSDAIIADATGDGAADLLLLVHDRVIVYPQMTGGAPSASEARAVPERRNEPAAPKAPEQSRRIGD